MYLCRWPNGGISFVVAANKQEAVSVDHLDQFGPAEEWMLTPVPDFFMIDLKLTDEGSLELEDLGEDLWGFVLEKAYPVLNRVMLEHPGAQDSTDAYIDAVRDAVVTERQRLLTGAGRPEPSDGEEPEAGG